ncbi:MAG: aminoacyl-tRNA hydrolase [Tannerellaceae bacterium]|jgi:PTH1 family peptidyl-tRNA hydrolase|nr:aminoacyl-tRNA hydrolase [Tannerellaceae bacterium]
MEFLVAGLGNIGAEYAGTRHNVGFRIVNRLAEDAAASFTAQRYGSIARFRVKNAGLILLKPNTYMNLSGDAIRYWLQKEEMPIERLLVVVDDLALPFGTLRIKPQGSHAGHNGLKNIQDRLATSTYARLRFGIGNDFPQGRQLDYVLGAFTPEETEALPPLVTQAADMVRSFCLSGIQTTMNLYNNKPLLA